MSVDELAVSKNVEASKVPAVIVNILVAPNEIALPSVTVPLTLLIVRAGVFEVAVEITPESD